MNLIFHQFKTDWLHFRGWLLVLWAFFAAQLLLAGSFINSDWASGMQFIVLLFQILLGAFLLARLIQADALVGSSAQWLTRPMRRTHLFWSKSAFILVCVVLPRLLPQTIISGWHHYTFDLFLTSVATLLIFVLFIVWLLAALAALTPDLPRFFLALGLLIGGFFIGTAAFIYFHRHDGGRSTSLTESSLTLAFLFCGCCALLVWIWQAFAGRPAVGFVVVSLGLLALPVILADWPWDFLTPRVHLLRSALSVSSLDETGPPSDPSDGQALWSEFLLTGLPAHSLVVAENATATFTPDGKTQVISLPSFNNANYYRNGIKLIKRVPPMNSSQRTDYLAVIRQFFPPETLWDEQPQDDNWGNNWSGFPGTGQIIKRNSKMPRTGSLSCKVEFDQFQVESAAQIPLRPGTWNIAPGRRLVIHKLIPQQNGVSLEIEEISATPLLSRTLYGSDSDMAGPSRNFGTYVLYHPDWGEADVLANNGSYSFMPDILNGEERQTSTYVLTYPLLQERLAGISLQDFLNKARLYVFMPKYEGTIRQTLAKTNFDLTSIHSPDSTQAEDQKNLEAIQSTLLPAQPTVAQMSDYLDTIFWHLPDNATDPQRRKIQRRLEAVGEPGVPLILARLPLDARTEQDYVFPMLSKLATRDQLPELREALGRDLQLAEWFHEMNWDNDARDVVAGKLSDHRQKFPAVALLMAAEARNPATYSDLAWHFVRLGDQQAQVADALAQCPGFDLAGAVREAWSRVRLGLNQPGELSLLAAQQGLPDAFNRAVIQLEQSRDSKLHRQEEARQITALTDFSGSPDTALDWLSANLGQFHYDDATRRYLLTGQ